MILEKVLENQKKCGIMYYVNLEFTGTLERDFTMDNRERFYNILEGVYEKVRLKKDFTLSVDERRFLIQYSQELGASYEDAKKRSQEVGVDLEEYVGFYKGLLNLYLVSGAVNPEVDRIGLELDEAFNK